MVHADNPTSTREHVHAQEATQTQQQLPATATVASSKPTGLRNVLSSSAAALAGRAYACAPSQTATGRSNNSSTSGAGSVMVHSRGSSIQEAPAVTQSQVHSPAMSEIEPCTAKTTDAHASSSRLSNIQVTELASSASAGMNAQGDHKGWQHAEEARASPLQHRPQMHGATAVPASSPFPLKLAEVTEADRLEQRSQASAQLPHSAVVSRVLGRIGGSVLDKPVQVRHPAMRCLDVRPYTVLVLRHACLCAMCTFESISGARVVAPKKVCGISCCHKQAAKGNILVGTVETPDSCVAMVSDCVVT